jgi:hypothetical protein
VVGTIADVVQMGQGKLSMTPNDNDFRSKSFGQG